MRPLALKQTRRPRSDRGKARHSVSSSSSHHHSMSSHQHDDDDDDVETYRASTPSPNTYLNSLNPLNYQNYEMPSASEQTDETIFERQTTLLNQTQEMHKEMRGGFKSFGKALKGVAVVANALPNLTAALRTQMTNDIRNGAESSCGSGGGGGDAIPQGIHVWIERFTKLKPLAFRSAATPAEAEDWITHMKKLF
ncbi:hypothetical protein Tco_1542210 [Tanacetum coccineum]